MIQDICPQPNSEPWNRRLAGIQKTTQNSFYDQTIVTLYRRISLNDLRNSLCDSLDLLPSDEMNRLQKRGRRINHQEIVDFPNNLKYVADVSFSEADF